VVSRDGKGPEVESLDRQKRTRTRVEAEQKVGRTDPPTFMFESLRTPVLDGLAGPSGLASKVVSVVAPVGYGKTVLMSLLLADLRRAGKQCIWFALDERDTAVEGLIGALKALLDGRASKLHPTQALFSGDEPLDRRIDVLIELMNRSALPLTIFLDNLHYCTDAGLGRLLDRLCFGTRPSIHLVLSGTRELPFNAPRAVLEGLLRQVGPADLRHRVIIS
jgi:LuxR family transcriptional regulator, maltose regulon positive regulatory protein